MSIFLLTVLIALCKFRYQQLSVIPEIHG